MSIPAVLVVTGASGVGKTAAVRALEARDVAGVRCYYFDSIGVPSIDDMWRDFGGPERWQALTTGRWVNRFAANADGAGVCVLDGQTRPTFVHSAAEAAGIRVARVLLLDCAPDVRHARLVTQRNQPELSNAQMDCWAAYLRGQADALNVPVIDTTDMGIDTAVDALLVHVEALFVETRDF
jgi:AAA domain